MRQTKYRATQIGVRASPVTDPEDQLDVRLRQMISTHTDAYLLAAIDHRVNGRIAAAVESACARIVAAGGAPLLGLDADPPLGRLQSTLAHRFDLEALDAAIDAIVDSRVKALYDVATASREVPATEIDVSGVPTMTEEEAVRASRIPLDDPRLRSLGSAIDIDEDEP